MVKAQKCCCRVNWEIRNNSSNVAAVLNPTRVKFHSSHNTCYCNQKQVRPQLFSRPKKCIFDESDEDEDTDLVQPLPTYRLNLGSAYRVPQLKKSLKALTDKTASTFDNKSSFYDSEYSSSSAPLPSYSRNVMGVSSSEYHKPSRSVIVDEPSYKNGEYGKKRGETSSVTQSDEENGKQIREASQSVGPFFLPSKNEESSSETPLKQLSEFRRDHYFDTHSTEDLIKTVPEHTCVHRFGLDDRFLPHPLNTDVYGESRCIICDKPMENPVGHKTDERFRNDKKAIFPKFYKYGLAPKKIYMGSDDNVKMELILKHAQNDKWECQMGKKPNYFNTYALRYQKGVKS